MLEYMDQVNWQIVYTVEIMFGKEEMKEGRSIQTVQCGHEGTFIYIYIYMYASMLTRTCHSNEGQLPIRSAILVLLHVRQE